MVINEKVVNDLGAFMGISTKVLGVLIKKLNLCIGSAIHDAILNNETVSVINIGIGTLSIELSSMQCKFIPSKDLKTVVKFAIDNKIDPVELELEQALIAKLTNVCNEEI